MKEIGDYIVEQAVRTESLLIEVGKCDSCVRDLYEKKLKVIFKEIKAGSITAPSDALIGFSYYFSPEGPWQLWEKYPQLVTDVATLMNLLNLRNDAEFDAYCRRHGIGG
ncbi:hypothetical protein [Paraburkholderia rhizosphaerae]|uniref:hypothetical protein n=1 Tax=Paraburkholderia rhizosphaerae TaxID=480658 RepID=UPI0010659D7E|nr:hypothetical protein [Paraburkholderia rhizosphaerae]